MKLKNAGSDDIIEKCQLEVVAEVIHRLTKSILDKEILLQRIRREKQLIEMRKEPGHEAWMEQR